MGGLQQSGSLRNYSASRLSSCSNLSTNGMDDRMTSIRIVSSTLAMLSSSRALNDNDNTNQHWECASIRSAARTSDSGTLSQSAGMGRRSSTRSSRGSIGSAGLLTISRKSCSSLVPVAETTTTTTTTADC